MNTSVSIVIPTYKRAESLSRLLANLAKNIDKKIEILIVEQEINHGASYKNLAKMLGLKLRYHFLKHRSTAQAMNMGGARASGEYILFLDDDVTVTKNIVYHHRKNFSDPRVAATVGRIITDGQIIEPARTDTGRVNWLGTFRDGFSSTIRQEVDTVIGCNTMWRTSIYRKLRGIDEQFTGNALRLESDISLRAKKEGYTIIFEPAAQVAHHRAEAGGARKTEGRIAWYRDFFSNETYFFLKHRPHILLPIFLLSKTDWAVRCMFGFGREVSVRSITTPFIGIISGIQKYKKLKTRLPRFLSDSGQARMTKDSQ